MSTKTDLQEQQAKEVWSPVKLGFGDYQISSQGRLRNGSRELKPSISTNGYLHFTAMSRKLKRAVTMRIHRLVAESFLPKTQGSVVNHKDGNKLNNTVDNLEWVTSSKNNAHAYELGLRKPAKQTWMLSPERKAYVLTKMHSARYGWSEAKQKEYAAALTK